MSLLEHSKLKTTQNYLQLLPQYNVKEFTIGT